MALNKDTPLYKALINYLPAFVATTPMVDASPAKTINVRKLRVALQPERSHEAVYKWFRAGKLKPENARDLYEVSRLDENVLALNAAGHKPPTLTDFLNLTLA